eukprot:2048439-Prymnesium_polylepis.1
MSLNWNHCVSLIDKPKGARKHAADARLERYKKQIVAAMPSIAHAQQPAARTAMTTEETRKCLEDLLTTSNANKSMSATAQRRARQKAEMMTAAASLISSSPAASVAPAAPTLPAALPAALLAPSTDYVAQAHQLASLEQQVALLSQQVASVAGLQP